MTKPSLPAALERLEGVASEALEELIGALEKEQDVHVKEVDVALVPDSRGEGTSVVVSVAT